MNVVSFLFGVLVGVFHKEILELLSQGFDAVKKAFSKEVK